MDSADYLHRLLPHRMNALSIMALMLEFRLKWQEPKHMQIFVDGKVQFEGMTSMFMNPILEAGALHARALLEFIGLKTAGGKLVQLDPAKRQADDVGIEMLSGTEGPLSLVTPLQARESYALAPDLAESALAGILVAANKGMAHSSATYFDSPFDSEQALLAATLVPKIIETYVYLPLGVSRPPIPIEARARR